MSQQVNIHKNILELLDINLNTGIALNTYKIPIAIDTRLSYPDSIIYGYGCKKIIHGSEFIVIYFFTDNWIGANEGSINGVYFEIDENGNEQYYDIIPIEYFEELLNDDWSGQHTTRVGIDVSELDSTLDQEQITENLDNLLHDIREGLELPEFDIDELRIPQRLPTKSVKYTGNFGRKSKTKNKTKTKKSQRKAKKKN